MADEGVKGMMMVDSPPHQPQQKKIKQLHFKLGCTAWAKTSQFWLLTLWLLTFWLLTDVNNVSYGVSHTFQLFCTFLGGFYGFLVKPANRCFPRLLPGQRLRRGERAVRVLRRR